MSNYRCEYTYYGNRNRPEHMWVVIGARGAIHLGITDRGDGYEGNERFDGGLEMHWRSPPKYMADFAPSHDECHILKSPCWHDGSSLIVDELWIPRWQAGDPHDHEAMFRLLEQELDMRVSEVEDE